jgi:hypothetical protein
LSAEMKRAKQTKKFRSQISMSGLLQHDLD